MKTLTALLLTIAIIASPAAAMNEDHMTVASLSRDGVSSLTQTYRQVLPSVCWIRSHSDDTGAFYMGTGWVIDAQLGLIVTNQHVVDHHEHLLVNFPEFNSEQRLISETDYYMSSPNTLPATVLVVDVDRDLAVLQLDSIPHSLTAVTLAAEDPNTADELFTIAALPEGSEGLWGMTTGHVRLTYRRSHANQSICQVVETDLAANRGNSGGAVFNGRGEVVAVFEGFNTEARLVSMSIAISEVKALFAEAAQCMAPVTADDYLDRYERRNAAGHTLLAAEDVRSALQLDAANVRAMVANGQLLIASGDYLTAQVVFQECLKASASSAEALNGLGVTECLLGQYDASFATLTKAIMIDSTSAKSYRDRGVTLTWLDKWDDAISDLRRAIELDPNVAEYHATLAQVLSGCSIPTEAEPHFVTAIELEPENVTYWNNAGYFYLDHNKLDAAEQALNRSLELNEHQAEVYAALGNVHLAKQMIDQAATVLVKAIELDPENAVYFNELGNVLATDGNFRGAIDCYTRSIELDATDATTFRNRAICHQQLGETDLAQKDAATADSIEAQQNS